MRSQVVITVMAVIGLILFYKFVDKDSLMWSVTRNLPATEAGLVKAIVVGDKSGLEKDFYEKLKICGLVHLVVVSGSNVTMLATLIIESLAKWCGRKKAIGLGIGVVIMYGNLVGWEAPILRAVVLLTIYYWGQILGRKMNIWRGIIVAVVVMVVIDIELTTSVSFWLSLTAFMGIISFSSLRWRQDNWWQTSLVGSIWIAIWLTPILAICFGKISLVGPWLNVGAMVVVELITLIGGIGMLIGVVVPEVGKLILWTIYPLTRGLVEVVEMAGGMKWSSLNVKFNWLMLVGWYLILGYYLVRRRNEN